VLVERRRQITQRARHVLGRVGQRCIGREPVGPRRVAQDVREHRQSLLHIAELARQRRDRRTRQHELVPGIAHQQFDLAAAETRAEELRGEIGDLVSFVEDHRIGRAQQIAETVFLEREVGEQQMVIDDDDIGIDGLAARVDHVALADVGAAGAEAVVTRGGDLRPQRVRIAHVRHFGKIAGPGDSRPALDAGQRAIARAGEAFLATHLLQPVAAQIVRAALEQCDPRRDADGGGDQWQVFVEQLVLQGARARGDEHPLAGKQRGNQVSERLAGSRARLDHERRAVFQRQRDAAGHGQLRTARREIRQRAGQRPARSEYFVQ